MLNMPMNGHEHCKQKSKMLSNNFHTNQTPPNKHHYRSGTATATINCCAPIIIKQEVNQVAGQSLTLKHIKLVEDKKNGKRTHKNIKIKSQNLFKFLRSGNDEFTGAYEVG